MVVSVEIQLPENVVAFLDFVEGDVIKYCQRVIMQDIIASIDAGEWGRGIVDKKLRELKIDLEKLIEEYE